MIGPDKGLAYMAFAWIKGIFENGLLINCEICSAQQEVAYGGQERIIRPYTLAAQKSKYIQLLGPTTVGQLLTSVIE